MKARLVECKGTLTLLIQNGKILRVTIAEAREFLIDFNNPNLYAEPGVWDYEEFTIEAYSGDTIAYVCDEGYLHVLQAEKYKNILSESESIYLTVAEFAEQHGKQIAIVRRMCQNGRIEGAIQKGKSWLIPATSPYPVDRRSRP